MKDVTAKEVKDAWFAKQLTSVKVRHCSICDWPLFMMLSGQELYFDSNCGCTAYYSDPQFYGWEQAADWINMQTKDEIKIELAALFGLELKMD